MRRSSSIALFVAVLSLVVLTGCIPEAVIWSPDGHWGIVVDKDHLVVCDSNGKLSKPFLDGMAESFTPAAWLPDSQRFLVVRERQVDQQALSKWLVNQKKQKLLKKANLLRKELLAYKGNWDSFKPSALQGLSSAEKAAVLLHLRQTLGSPLPEPYHQWKQLTNLSGSTEIRMVQLVEMVDGQPKLGRTLIETLEKIDNLRMSPDGKNFAFVSEAELDIISKPTIQSSEETEISLFVVSIEDSNRARCVAHGVSIYPDWSLDSQSLVYVAPLYKANVPGVDKDTALGAVFIRRVASEKGVLLKKFDEAKPLATLLYWPWEWVGCLDDGRILFTGMEVTLPTTKQDMPEDATLFVLDPRQPTVTRVLPRKARAQLTVNGLIFGCVSLSPDKKRLAIIGKDNEVCILTLATGEVTIIQEGLPGTKTDHRPSWRTNDELCLVAPAGSKLNSKDRSEIILWSKGKSRCISRQWHKQFEKTKGKKSN